MFIFVEGGELNVDLNLEIPQEYIFVNMDLTFSGAIRMLASRTKKSIPSVTIFTNFFSVGCRKLTPSHMRGLERLAMSDTAIEIINKEKRSTRFLLTIKALAVQKSIGLLHTMIDDYVGHGIGNLSVGNTLIIGESPGPNANGFNIPFVGTGCGLWLSRQLDLAHVDERNLYWINALDEFNKEVSNDFMVYLRPSQIITLGVEAKQWALKYSVIHPITNIHHPQYWLRFRSKEEYPLLQLLK